MFLTQKKTSHSQFQGVLLPLSFSFPYPAICFLFASLRLSILDLLKMAMSKMALKAPSFLAMEITLQGFSRASGSNLRENRRREAQSSQKLPQRPVRPEAVKEDRKSWLKREDLKSRLEGRREKKPNREFSENTENAFLVHVPVADPCLTLPVSVMSRMRRTFLSSSKTPAPGPKWPSGISPTTTL